MQRGVKPSDSVPFAVIWNVLVVAHDVDPVNNIGELLEFILLELWTVSS